MATDIFPELFTRAEADFPMGDNDTDVVFGDRHFNLTILEHFNYLVYSNGTVSNNSKCFLTYEPHEPVELHKNGSWVNATSCYTSIYPIGTRGYTGIAFAAAFGITLVLVLTCLAKHGKSYLPREKRFYPIGRRWQWYWGSFVCACALISLFLNIDVDRFPVQHLPIIVTSFFWYLMCMGITACVWEAVRHWGSWQERQYIDPNPFALSEDDRRAKVEFFLPLIFYFLVWMNFFLVIPRNWTFAQKQRSPEQMAAIAAPTATSIRFKIGAFFLFAAWCVILFSLRHSVKHYKPRNRGIINRSIGLIQAIPLRFILILPLLLSVIAYQALIAWDFNMSVIKADGPVGIIYGWGYGAQLTILLVQIAYGYASPNEDKELMKQRRVRGDTLDRELGLVQRPAWWRRVKGEHLVGTFRDKLLRNVQEVGGGHGTGRREEGDMERHIREEGRRDAQPDDEDYGIELNPVGRRDYNPRVDRAGVNDLHRQPSTTTFRTDEESQRMLRMASEALFPNAEDTERRDREAEAERARRLAYLTESGPPPAYTDNDRAPSGSRRPATSERSNSTGTANSITSPPTQIRSMLDL